jgi:hypothetical protein
VNAGAFAYHVRALFVGLDGRLTERGERLMKELIGVLYRELGTPQDAVNEAWRMIESGEAYEYGQQMDEPVEPSPEARHWMRETERWVGRLNRSAAVRRPDRPARRRAPRGRRQTARSGSRSSGVRRSEDADRPPLVRRRRARRLVEKAAP